MYYTDISWIFQIYHDSQETNDTVKGTYIW